MTVDPQALRDHAHQMRSASVTWQLHRRLLVEDGAKRLDAAADTIDALRKDASKWRARWEAASSECGRLSVEVRDLHVMLVGASERDRAWEEREEARAEVARLRDDYGRMSAALDRRVAEVARLRGQADDLMSAKDDAEREVARLRDAFASLKDYAASQTHRTAFVDGVENIARAALGEGT